MSEPSVEEKSSPADPAQLPERPRRRRYRALAIVLGLALVVQIAVVVAAPYWAPVLVPLLPWGSAPDAKFADRVEQLESAVDRLRQAEAQQSSAFDLLGRRTAALEAKQTEQQQAASKAAATAQQLEPRIAALEAAKKQEQQSSGDAGAKLQRIESRLAGLEASSGPSPKELADLRQQVEKLAGAQADLSDKVVRVDKSAPAQAAADPTDAALLLTLLQIREAVQTGRPFQAEQEALTALARGRPEIAEAAASMADASRTGVATGAVLAKRLHELAGSIAKPEAPRAEADWRSEALARLRALISIRRIGGGKQGGPGAAVREAETALAAGDLPGAVAALDQLAGASAEAARPWLQMARQRQHVDDALRRVEKAVAARLGKPADPAAVNPPG